MKQKKYPSFIAIAILISPFFTITSIADLVKGHSHSPKKALLAWEVDKTNSRHSWKIKREEKEKA